MKTSWILLFSVVAGLPVRGQEIQLFPRGLNVPPLRTNLQEPRIGLVKSVNAGEMRVDVGNSVDLVGLRDDSLLITAGIDFFAYALVTGTEGLRLQIDAVDGFFGGNLSASYATGSGRLLARLRLLHHSAHLVDAHDRTSIPFTQDFGELVLGHEPSATVRYYAGVSYATLVRPVELQRFAYLAGVEVAGGRMLLGSLAGQPLLPFAAYTASLNGTPAYGVTHTLQAGVKLGRFFEKGASVFVEWYSGRHMLAEYYQERMSFIGVGFAVDFF